VAPGCELERPREDDLRHGGELVGELLLWTLLHVRPEASERAIGDSAEQKRVDRVHKVHLLLAKARIDSGGGGDEVDAIVRTCDQAIDADEFLKDDLSDCVSAPFTWRHKDNCNDS